jgi:alkanesulfonate monooxygenase SsuD/methylene tetrahydromethanopterin reductase-like flavin-dependent oxidoreductase (luciferase family)
LVTCQRNPADPEGRDDARIYQEAIELARLVEAVGLDSYWVSEHHFLDDSYLPSVLPVLAAAASVTERVGLGAGVILAPFHDPIRLAEDGAVVDLLSGGRLLMGLGLGWVEEEFAGFGLNIRERVRRTEDVVATLRAAWDPAGVVGDAGVIVTPKPYRPGGPPILLGGAVEAAVRRAAALADGFIALPSPQDVEQFAKDAAIMQTADRPVEVHAIANSVFVWDGPEDPWDVIREYHWFIRWKYLDARELHGLRAGRPPLGPPPVPPEAEARAGSYIGRPEEVLDALRALTPHISENGHLVLRNYFPGLPWEMQKQQVELLGEIASELTGRPVPAPPAMPEHGAGRSSTLRRQ